MLNSNIKNKQRTSRFLKPASALLLAMFIITSIIIIALGGASLALSGIKMADVQSQSTKAYFAAEAGAEELLYRVRKDESISLGDNLGEVISAKVLPNSEASYWVYFTEKYADNPEGENTFTSLGAFLNTRRSVDLRF